jgi:energy-coupling factor transporter ATP-binding protein EcfA2
MTTFNSTSMTLKATQEFTPGIETQKGKVINLPFQKKDPRSFPKLISQTIQEIFSQNPCLPADSLLLGVASDGRPIVLSLTKTDPCPVVVIGEAGCGKTQLLQTLAQAIDLSQETPDIQFGVLTDHPDEWKTVDTLPGNTGVWPANHPSSREIIQSMVDWARQPEHGRQVKILFLDDLASVLNTGNDVQDNIRWLLENGGKNHVWVAASINVLKAIRMRKWLDLFNTQIFGYIQQPSIARAITTGYPSDFESLEPGLEFDIKQQEGWLRFCLPSIGMC